MGKIIKRTIIEPMNISEEIPEELIAEGVFENPTMQVIRDSEGD